jgi:hypothetical protein
MQDNKDDIDMTEVTLTEFSFALPTVVSLKKGLQEKFISSTEFPQEFFGLSPINQVAVLNGLLCAVMGHVKKEKDQLNREMGLVGADSFPINIGIGVTVKRSPDLCIDANFNFPESWGLLSGVRKEKVLESVAHLLQAAAISIVNREVKLEGAYE